MRYKGISGSQKVFFINFKEDIAAEDIRDVGLSVTDIERDDNHILNKIMMITKGNVGAYETKNPVK